MNGVTRKSALTRRPGTQALPLLLIGIGLLALGGAALLWLPKPAADAARPGGDSIENYALVVPAKVNYPAPQLQLSDMQGQPAALSDFLGQVVLVNNWATWCPPCKAEMPELQAYYAAHQEQNFILLAIGSGETAQKVQDFAEAYGLTFTLWPDPASSALMAFRNDALPSSYVIDASGQVVLAWTGPVSQATLEKYVTPLLEE
jgi:peroxiredoxin